MSMFVDFQGRKYATEVARVHDNDEDFYRVDIYESTDDHDSLAIYFDTYRDLVHFCQTLLQKAQAITPERNGESKPSL